MEETELRRQLRQLPRELELPRDLWPGIAGRLTRRPARRRAWVAGVALAASLVLAIGLGVALRAPEATPTHGQARLVHREAAALTREYEAALGGFRDAPVPEQIAPVLATLDRSAVEIRQALEADPDAVFLIEQLRRTYARRLSLTQRAAIG